jgi:uncharacterized protein (DUF58 family)
MSQATQHTIGVSLEELMRLQQHANEIPLFNRKRSYLTGQGHHISPFKGRGIDFDEVRGYQNGDDIRFMDWRVTARTSQPHTKVFHEERERPVLLIVDQGASMWFGTRVTFKSIIAAKLAATLGWAAMQQGERVGGLIYAGLQCQQLRPQSRKQGVLPLLKALSEVSTMPTQNDRAFEHALHQLQHIAKPGSLLIFLSDFHGYTPTAHHHLMQLACHCDLLACFVYDPLEANPPPANFYGISDGSRVAIMNTFDTKFCTHYQNRFIQHRDAVKQRFQECRAHLFEFATSDPLIAQLKKQL